MRTFTLLASSAAVVHGFGGFSERPKELCMDWTQSFETMYKMVDNAFPAAEFYKGNSKKHRGFPYPHQVGYHLEFEDPIMLTPNFCPKELGIPLEEQLKCAPPTSDAETCYRLADEMGCHPRNPDYVSPHVSASALVALIGAEYEPDRCTIREWPGMLDTDNKWKLDGELAGIDLSFLLEYAEANPPRGLKNCLWPPADDVTELVREMFPKERFAGKDKPNFPKHPETGFDEPNFQKFITEKRPELLPEGDDVITFSPHIVYTTLRLYLGYYKTQDPDCSLKFIL